MTLGKKRYYECMMILRSRVDVRDHFDGLIDLLKNNDKEFELTRVEDLGMRSFAYPIKKLTSGRYFLINFSATVDNMLDFESALDADNEVIRHLITNTDGRIEEPSSLMNALEREAKAAEEAEEQAEEQAEDARSGEAVNVNDVQSDNVADDNLKESVTESSN